MDASSVQTSNDAPPNENNVVKQQTTLAGEKSNGNLSANPRRSSGSQDAINASPSGVSSSMGTIERLKASISSIENNIHALITKLAHVPVEKRAEIENQISQMKVELGKAQYALEEAKKASLNSEPNAPVSIIYRRR